MDDSQASLERRIALVIFTINRFFLVFSPSVAAYDIAKGISARTWQYAMGPCILILTPFLDRWCFSKDTVSLLQVYKLSLNTIEVFLSCCLLLPIREMAQSVESRIRLSL